MKGSWRQWRGAGTKTSMCCVHTQLWLYGITTTVLTAPDSTGQTFCIHLLNYTHTRHFSLHYKTWASRTLRSCSLQEELCLMTSLHLYGLYLTFGSVVINYWNSYCRCYIATASPAKFQAAVEKAGLTFDLPQAVLELDKLATRYENLERSVTWCKDWEDRLREKIQSVSAVRKNRGTYYIWLCRCYCTVLLQKPWFGRLTVCGWGQVIVAALSSICAPPYLNVVNDVDGKGLLSPLWWTLVWTVIQLVFVFVQWCHTPQINELFALTMFSLPAKTLMSLYMKE